MCARERDAKGESERARWRGYQIEVEDLHFQEKGNIDLFF